MTPPPVVRSLPTPIRSRGKTAADATGTSSQANTTAAREVVASTGTSVRGGRAGLCAISASLSLIERLPGQSRRRVDVWSRKGIGRHRRVEQALPERGRDSLGAAVHAELCEHVFDVASDRARTDR